MIIHYFSTIINYYPAWLMVGWKAPSTLFQLFQLFQPWEYPGWFDILARSRCPQRCGPSGAEGTRRICHITSQKTALKNELWRTEIRRHFFPELLGWVRLSGQMMLDALTENQKAGVSEPLQAYNWISWTSPCVGWRQSDSLSMEGWHRSCTRNKWEHEPTNTGI